MTSLVSLTCIFLLCVFEGNSNLPDYFWRDFDGEIPRDALPVGKDTKGKEMYVVQAYIHEYGLFFTGWRQGSDIAEIPCHGVVKTKKLLKILCSKNKQNFKWVSTSKSSFNLDMIGKHPVVGGYDHRRSNLQGFEHIGRVTFQGSLQICQITSFNPGDILCYFVYEGASVPSSTDSYQALIYEDNGSTPSGEDCVQVY